CRRRTEEKISAFDVHCDLIKIQLEACLRARRPLYADQFIQPSIRLQGGTRLMQYAKEVNAAPLLAKLAEVLQRHALEAVLIGNAAAAVHGSPVTTLDFDFMFQSTPGNLKKLNAVAADLDATLYRPYRFSSGMLRIQNEDYGLL